MRAKVTAILLTLILLFSFCGCSTAEKSDGKLNIVTTVFPLYDFARAIVGDKASIELLIDPGCEVHTYEPKPSDMRAVGDADLVLTIGGESETWVEKLLQGSGKKSLKLLEHISNTHSHEEGHSHADEHIWTSPTNARIMIDEICEEIVLLDSENADYYKKNAESYKAEIKSAGEKIEEALGENRYILVADRFPFYYFAEEYGIEYDAAFGGCAVSTDISIKTMNYLTKKISEKKCDTVYYIEMSSKNIASALCEETGVNMRELHSAHNVTLDDFNAGVTYADILIRNAEALKE